MICTNSATKHEKPAQGPVDGLGCGKMLRGTVQIFDGSAKKDAYSWLTMDSQKLKDALEAFV